MKNFKFILGFTIFGFLLSFAAGLSSRSGAGSVLLHALLFAVVFFCLALGIQFLFSKLFSAEQDSFAPEQAARTQGAANSGHAVDIVIQDEELPSEENAPGFFVGTSHNMLTPNDMNVSVEAGAAAAESGRTAAAEAPSPEPSAPPAPQGGVVPLRLAEGASNLSGTEAKSAKEIEAEGRQVPSVPPSGRNDEDGDELDVLPDLESIEGVAAAPEPSEDDASGGGAVSSGGEMAEPAVGISDVADGKDAALMAKAISTLLASEH
ncbi:MAG: hypothetical protein K2H09_06820 [Treponemataceae bacterium]|nr:hypothetical protein [Treponemataceae bacterium]